MIRARIPAASALALLLLSGPAVTAQQKPKAPANELDAFMEKVLARREVNRKMLNDYVLDEKETFEVLGPGRIRLYRTHREYMWFVRDGIHVRSPLRVDGVAIPEEQRRSYEAGWIARMQRRAKRAAERAARKAEGAKPSGGGEIVLSPSGIEVSKGSAPFTEPAFVSDAYFMEFKFDAGNYYLAGRERLEDHDVLRIEYYPTNLFDDGPEDGGVKGGRDEPRDAKIARQMNKTSLVTLWVDPTEHQIVKYTFDNVWLDFLPAQWLVRVDDTRASMVMGQPFKGVWLPRAINIHMGGSLANGSYEGSYTREFSEYREADVKTRVRIPQEPR